MENDASSPAPSAPMSAAEMLAVFGERIDAVDRHGAVALALDSVSSASISIPNLYTQVLGPYLVGVGSQWRHGSERVWQEHFASHVVRTIVEALYPGVIEAASTVPRRGETVLLACPPREEHELGLRMLSDRFEMAGYRTVFLGADMPIAEIVAAGSAVHASIVALSVSTMIERVEVRGFIDRIRTELPGARVVLGGPSFVRELGEWAGDGLLDPAELGLPGSPPVV